MDEQEPMLSSDDSSEDEVKEDMEDAPEEADFQPETMSDQDFIEHFLRQNNVTVGYRWTSVREGQLVGALLEKKVRTQATVMIQKIKAYLTVRAAALADE